MKLDLHGVKHEDVQKILDKFIYKHMKLKTSRIYIITGHSSKMKSIVREIVNEYDLSSNESMFNSAEIIIDLIVF